MSGALRLAIVGAGWAGRRQAEAAREFPDEVEVVALVDADEKHLQVAAEELGIARSTTSLDEVLADEAVDAISICTPHELHEPQALQSIAAGKHVLVEKPMATSVAAATRMIEAASAAGVMLYVAEQAPYEERFEVLREVVSSGDPIGELSFAACTAGQRTAEPGADPVYGGRSAWLSDPAAGATGDWMLLGVHTVAALRYILGEVATVYMLEHRTGSFERDDLEATMAGTLVLESGVVVAMAQTSETDLRPRLSGFRLYGDRGVVIGREHSYDVYVGDPRTGDQPRTVPYPPQEHSAFALELAAFAEAVRGSLPGPTSGESERRTLAVIEAGYESARTGQPIDLRERYPEIWPDRG